MRDSRAFTIVETMIFMAVTGVLFTSAILLIGGQQRKAQFTQALYDFESRVRDTMNDVIKGNYQQASYTCSHGPTFSATATTNQGGNKNCVFVGKVLHIGGADKSDYQVYTLAGNRYTTAAATTEASNIKETAPVVITHPLPIDLNEQFKLPYGIEFLSAYSGANYVFAVGFFNTFTGFIDSTSGGTQLDLRMVRSAGPTTSTTTHPSTAIGTLNSIGLAPSDEFIAPKLEAGGVSICIGNEDQDLYGKLLIGGSAKNTVELTFVNNYDPGTRTCF